MRISVIVPDILVAVILALVLIFMSETEHFNSITTYPYVLGIVCYGIGRFVSVVQFKNRLEEE